MRHASDAAAFLGQGLVCVCSPRLEPSADGCRSWKAAAQQRSHEGRCLRVSHSKNEFSKRVANCNRVLGTPSRVACPNKRPVKSFAAMGSSHRCLTTCGKACGARQAPKRAWTGCESCVNENAVFAIGPGLLNVFETIVKCSKSDFRGVPYSVLAH